MRVGNHQMHPAAPRAVSEWECQSAGTVLGRGDIDPEDLALTIKADADRDQAMHVDHTAILSHGNGSAFSGR